MSSETTAAKKLMDYPVVREDNETIISELRKELDPSQWQSPLIRELAALAKQRGFRVTEDGERKDEIIITPVEIFCLVVACYGQA